MNDDVYSSDRDFRLSDDQLEFQRHCHAFARDVMRPAAARHDREQRVPYDVIREARARGLHGIPYLGARRGGRVGDHERDLRRGAALGLRRHRTGDHRVVARGGASPRRGRPSSSATGLRGASVSATRSGSAPTRSRRPAPAPTSARCARPPGATATSGFWTARRSSSPTAGSPTSTIVATVDRDLGHRGQASFVVEKDTPGLRMGKKDDKLGIRASQTAEVVLDRVRVPMANLLGGLDRLERKLERARSGERSRASGALATFEITRPTVGASAVGIARAAYEWTIDHLEGRSDEHGPLLEQQRVQQVLADVATEIDAARLLVHRAAWMGRNGVPMTGGQGSMSKLKAGDVAMWATTALMDVVGPEAGRTDHPLEKWFRDAKIYQLFEGTAQVQRLVIARMQVAERRRAVALDEVAADADGAPERRAA